MRDPPIRTGTTWLTDDQLILLDAMFDGGTSFRMLRQDSFPDQWNFGYSHGLDDAALESNIRWLCEHGVLKRQRDGDREWIQMTRAGGGLWESERQPDWSRYVRDRYGRTRPDSERDRVAIFGYSPSTCRAFFDAGCESAFFDYRGGAVATGVGSRRLIYWRPEQPVYLLSAWLESPHAPTDWQQFERSRCWWRFAYEIGTLPGEGHLL